MYLKSIELYGFKSFAERTKIEFNGSLTCIVGPNGSGKSNITDSIKWALGEQSTMALRGNKMSDVIFSGSKNRRPLGFAEVILTFDNSSNYLDLDYDTVEIKRKLYKNGDSEYYINNSSCRLKDIRRLFMDTGIGKDGYSIIGQGKIDDILNSKPTERKLIFEEASGISKYKSEKEETQRKLNKVKENATRLSDLIYEINLQKNDLEEEAKLAKKYLEVFEEIKEKDIVLSIFDLKNLEKKTSSISESIKKTELDKAEIKKEQEKSEDEQKIVQENLDVIENKINELQALNVENVKAEKDLRNSIALNREKIISSKNATIEFAARIELLEKDIVNNESEIVNIKNNSNIIIDLISKDDEKEKQVKTQLAELSKEKDSVEDEIKGYNLELSKIKNIILEDEINTKNFNEKISSMEKNIKENTSQIEVLKSKHSEIEHNINKLNHDIAGKKKLLDEETSNLANLEKDDTKLVNNINSLEEKNSALKGEFSSKRFKLNTLENMEENYEGYNRTIKNFFNYINKNNIEFDGLIDTVGNILEVDKNYEKAITTSLGGAVQNIVVNEFSVAKKIINFLKDHNMGRITFLPIKDLKIYSNNMSYECQGYIGRASELVRYDIKYKKVIDFLLGNIYVVDSLENANSLSNKPNFNSRIVTLDGEIIYPGGSVTGGSMQVKGNIFNRKNEIKAIYKDINELEERINDNNTLLSEYRLEKSEFNNKIQEKIYIRKKLDKELLDLENQIFQAKLLSDNSINSINSLKIELEKDEENLRKFTSSVAGIADSLEGNTIEVERFNQILLEKNLKLLESENNISELNEELRKLEMNKSKNSSELAYLNKDLDRITNDSNKKSEDIKNLKKRIDDSLENSKVLEAENEIKEIELKNIEEVNSLFHEKNQGLQVQRRELLSSFNKYNDLINSLRGKSFQYEKDLLELKNELEKNINKEKDITNSLGDNYLLTLVSRNIDLDSDTAEKNRAIVRSGKKKLKSYGNVNLDSIKRYELVLERYIFNKEQYDDLIETKENLNKILNDIEVVMEEKFINSIKIINTKFNDIFSYMFNGGNAEIVLTDGDKLEDVGVDIVAQLPGKNKQALSALSGGERSMTAVSLLFAFLETRPSPFCLLDEVDAALDESNIYRFTSYLKTLDDIQFAIITHRKTTMESSDAIYGVTMDDPGISKVVSLKFEEGGNYA